MKKTMRLAMLLGSLLTPLAYSATEKIFKAGASVIDISPNGPTYNASFIIETPMGGLLDALHARCIAMDDGRERIAFVVVDSGSIPRRFLDEIKEAIRARTGLATAKILIAATHTHNAPAIQRENEQPNADYIKLLIDRIPAGVVQAIQNLRPARIGWTVIQDAEHTHTRRWIRRSDRIDLDPWGLRNVRANMQPGYQNPDVIGPSGPSDPDISIVALQTTDGRPIALLANYAMHYVGVPQPADGKLLVSADYYGRFADAISALVVPSSPPKVRGFHSELFNVPPEAWGSLFRTPVDGVPFVGIMAQGTSGDQIWQDYGKPSAGPDALDHVRYGAAIARQVYQAYQTISYRDWLPIHMVETELPVGNAVVGEERLARSREIVAKMAGRKPQTWSEVFATRAIELGAMEPSQKIKLQAISIGDLGFTAIPNEVYALTGLKLKAQSPLSTTINMELANGSNAYLPTPEQYFLGGYTTWPHPGKLEVQAEPKIVETMLTLLEQASGKPRRKIVENNGVYAKVVVHAEPLAYWRLNEMSGPMARDAGERGNRATYENGVAFYLDGPKSAAFSGGQINRAPHLAGGRLRSTLKLPPERYSVELWFWNGLPNDARGTTGWLFAAPNGDALGIGGTEGALGKVIFKNGQMPVTAGQSIIATKTWNHVVLVREGATVRIHLNGGEVPEITTASRVELSRQGEVFLGGRADGVDGLEGKIDEVSIYDRALSPLEIADHFRLAGVGNQ